MIEAGTPGAAARAHAAALRADVDIFIPQPDGIVRLRFAETQRGLAPGQVLAVYQDRVLMGGGVFI